MISQLLDIGQTWFLGFWARQYNTRPASEIDVPWYLACFGLILVIEGIFYCVGYTLYAFGSLKASRKVHKTLTSSILGTTLRWMDETPAGRIVARFTQDMRTIDSTPSCIGPVHLLTPSL
jgi:ABC-type multidrug transport system fused ATPase/permease subunit